MDGSGTTSTSQLSVTPTQLSFGSVNVGSSKNLTETIQATNADVNVSSAAWNGAGYSVSGITFPVTVKAEYQQVLHSYVCAAECGSRHWAAFPYQKARCTTNSPDQASFSGTGVQVAQQYTVDSELGSQHFDSNGI